MFRYEFMKGEWGGNLREDMGVFYRPGASQQNDVSEMSFQLCSHIFLFKC